MVDFSKWASFTSQKTNRSLAGSRVFIEDVIDENNCDNINKNAQKFLQNAQSWGIIPVDSKEDADFCVKICAKNLETTIDAPNLSGKDAIDYAQSHMPVMRTLLNDLQENGLNLEGVRIAVCLVLEPKTAVLLRELHAHGAIVGVFCGPDETDQRVADQLKKEGILVQANRDWSP